jgi:hypothetical protein
MPLASFTSKEACGKSLVAGNADAARHPASNTGTDAGQNMAPAIREKSRWLWATKAWFYRVKSRRARQLSVASAAEYSWASSAENPGGKT